MCGISGFLGDFEKHLLIEMNNIQAHRGPDDEGIYFEPAYNVGLAHRRLSIIDLTASGHQPMVSHDGRYVIVFNGEIYNFKSLRREIERQGVVFQSHSDTEVLLELYRIHGRNMLSMLNGIFAFAIWDMSTKKLFLTRDHFGVKPLYYAQTPSGVIFASEIKALLCDRKLSREIDRDAAASYLTYLWSPGERTMLRAVRKLEPGYAMIVDSQGIREKWRYYDIPRSYVDSNITYLEAIELVCDGLKAAVTRQMVSDVEVGAFLSGGLDSSALVALAQKITPERNMNCFTINYNESNNELISDIPYARCAAKHLGVKLHEVHVGSDIIKRLPEMIYYLDEPQADPAALNTMLICELARSHGIKVLLSGAGGDDLFTGYRRHKAAKYEYLWDAVPASLRGLIAGMISRMPMQSTVARRTKKLLQGISAPRNQRLVNYFHWLPAASVADLFQTNTADLGRYASDLISERLNHHSKGVSDIRRVLDVDAKYFLTDHNLNYTDKMGMARGVEVRVPFLDIDLVALAATIPDKFLIRNGQTKWILKKAMEGILPRKIIYRPKTGFGVPLRQWIRGPLRPIINDTFASETFRSRGLFNTNTVMRLMEDTLTGRKDGAYALLGVLCVELWCQQFVDKVPKNLLESRRRPL